MEIKQRGSALGYKIILFIYRICGYRFVVFILNFVALYYVIFTPSIKKLIKNYYEHQGTDFNNKVYFNHIKMFSLSIFDRFVSRINPNDLSFKTEGLDAMEELKDGGIVLFSHVGSWASAAHCLKDELQTMHIVMRENIKEDIKKVEKDTKRDNEENVRIIDLNQGAISANIQIANALINKELVALMVDRIVDDRQAVEVEFFKSKVKINKTPFDIAKRLKKPIVAIFVMNKGIKEYNLTLHIIDGKDIEEMAQNYINVLEIILNKYPNQWYNFYDFFKEGILK